MTSPLQGSKVPVKQERVKTRHPRGYLLGRPGRRRLWEPRPRWKGPGVESGRGEVEKLLAKGRHGAREGASRAAVPVDRDAPPQRRGAAAARERRLGTAGTVLVTFLRRALTWRRDA